MATDEDKIEEKDAGPPPAKIPKPSGEATTDNNQKEDTILVANDNGDAVTTETENGKQEPDEEGNQFLIDQVKSCICLISDDYERCKSID